MCLTPSKVQDIKEIWDTDNTGTFKKVWISWKRVNIFCQSFQKVKPMYYIDYRVKYFKPLLFIYLPRSIVSSPSAMLQWVELHLTCLNFLLRGGRCSRLLYLVWRIMQLWVLCQRWAPRVDSQHCGRWWAGLCVRSGTGDIIYGIDCERRSISCQCPLHKGDNIFSRTVFRRRCFASDVQTSIIEWAERIVWLAGDVS